jgi:hypothetical protein
MRRPLDAVACRSMRVLHKAWRRWCTTACRLVWSTSPPSPDRCSADWRQKSSSASISFISFPLSFSSIFRVELVWQCSSSSSAFLHHKVELIAMATMRSVERKSLSWGSFLFTVIRVGKIGFLPLPVSAVAQYRTSSHTWRVVVITYFVFVMHSWWDRLNYGTDDVMLTDNVTPVSPRMHNKNEEPNWTIQFACQWREVQVTDRMKSSNYRSSAPFK